MKFYGFVVESDVAFNSFQVRSGQVKSALIKKVFYYENKNSFYFKRP